MTKRMRIQRLMKAGTLTVDEACKAVNNGVITVDEHFNYFERDTVMNTIRTIPAKSHTEIRADKVRAVEALTDALDRLQNQIYDLDDLIEAEARQIDKEEFEANNNKESK